MKLFFQGIIKFLLGIIILGLLIFLPAWSLHYWQGWLLMGILFIPMFIAGLVMLALTGVLFIPAKRLAGGLIAVAPAGRC